jgi:hypothetical protein
MGSYIASAEHVPKMGNEPKPPLTEAESIFLTKHKNYARIFHYFLKLRGYSCKLTLMVSVISIIIVVKN